MTQTPQQERARQMLEQLWLQHRPTILERIEILERTAAALEAGSLTTEQRDLARSTAHKLAGALGTFGYDRGTRDSRELEWMFEAQSWTAEERDRIRETVAALRHEIEQPRAASAQ